MRSKRHKTMLPRTVASGSRERKADGSGYLVRQHQDTVPSTGQGPQGSVAVMVPFGAAPPCPGPAPGAGTREGGFRGR